MRGAKSSCKATWLPSKALSICPSQEDRIQEDHLLRNLRVMVDPILKEFSPPFNKLFGEGGRPSILR
jgi:hypothetical protein